MVEILRESTRAGGSEAGRVDCGGGSGRGKVEVEVGRGELAQPLQPHVSQSSHPLEVGELPSGFGVINGCPGLLVGNEKGRDPPNVMVVVRRPPSDGGG